MILQPFACGYRRGRPRTAETTAKTDRASSRARARMTLLHCAASSTATPRTAGQRLADLPIFAVESPRMRVRASDERPVVYPATARFRGA
jgi:hypothetical protein